jgi:hypothetical protein
VCVCVCVRVCVCVCVCVRVCVRERGRERGGRYGCVWVRQGQRLAYAAGTSCKSLASVTLASSSRRHGCARGVTVWWRESWQLLLVAVAWDGVCIENGSVGVQRGMVCMSERGSVGWCGDAADTSSGCAVMCRCVEWCWTTPHDWYCRSYVDRRTDAYVCSGRNAVVGLSISAVTHSIMVMRGCC